MPFQKVKTQENAQAVLWIVILMRSAKKLVKDPTGSQIHHNKSYHG